MERFSNFNEEKGVTLTGGGKTITLQKGQQVSFKHAITGKKVTGTFTKKVHRGGFQYAHVQMPDKTAMHVPVHHIQAGAMTEEVELQEHKSMDGETLKPGDNVGYKDGSEKYGSIHSISPDGNAKIKIYNSDTGEHEHITKHVKTLWKEEVEQIDEKDMVSKKLEINSSGGYMSGGRPKFFNRYITVKPKKMKNVNDAPANTKNMK